MWTYIVSNARLPGPSAGDAYGAFSLNTVLWSGADEPSVDDLQRAGALPLPWRAVAASTSYRVFVGVGSEKPSTLVPLVPAHAPVSFQRPPGSDEGWDRLLELLDDDWRRLVGRLGGEPAVARLGATDGSAEIGHDSWSGRIASLSQYGWPLAHELRLAAWVRLRADDLVGQDWFAVVPEQITDRAGRVFTPVPAEGTIEGGDWVLPYRAGGAEGLQLRVQLARVQPEAGDPLQRPFFAAVPAPQPAWRNWWRDLALQAGAVIDLWPWWERARAALPPVTDTPAVLRYLNEALCLAHHRSGPGLAGAGGKLGELAARDSVAVDVLKLVAVGGTEAAIAFVQPFLKAAVPLPTIANWRTAFADALERSPEYEVLLAWLRCPADSISPPPGRVPQSAPGEPGQVDHPRELALALRQMREALADETVLARLFLFEWQRLLGDDEHRLFGLAGLDPAGEITANRAQLAERLQQALAASGRGLALRFGDGAARRWLVTAAGDLLGHLQVAEPSVGGEAGSSQRAARRIFLTVLRAYATGAWAAAAGGYLRPSVSLVGDLRLPAPNAPAAADSEPADFTAAIVELTGDGERYQPPAVRTVHPLPVPLPAITERHLHQLSGAAVFSRRVEPDRPSDWQCATLGDLWLQDPRLGAAGSFRLAGSVLVPWQLVASDGVVQRWIEYRSRPLTVDPLEAEGGATSLLAADSGTPSPGGSFTVRHLQMAEPDASGYGPVTSLRYRDASVRYQFLFSPVHNTGALPGALQSAENPGRLTTLASLAAAAAEEPAIVDAGRRYSQAYRRRVGIGIARLVQPAMAAAASFGRQAPPAFELPPIPADVLPLANDLDPDRGPDDAFRTLLLHDGLRAVEFAVRPPATDFDNWRFWVRGGFGDAALGAGFDARIRSLEASVQHRLLLLGEAADAAAGVASIDAESVAQVLDDPAVVGVVLQLRALYADPRMGSQSPAGPWFVPITRKGRSLADWPENEAAAEALDASVFEFVRHVCGVEGRATRIRIELEGGEPDERAAANVVVIRVPRGVVWELSIAPCVAAADRERFDPGWSPFDGPIAGTWTDDRHYEVRQARQVWRIEAPPAQARDPVPEHDAQLPVPESAWRALRLSGGAGERDVRLRAELCPFDAGDVPTPEQRHRWAMVGHAEIFLQPWRWNGLPQDPAGLLTAASPGADVDDQTLQQMVAAEVTAFADRDDRDALSHESRVNFAPWLASRRPGAARAPLTTVRGEREAFGRYYRARVVLWSRYRGLREFRAEVEGARAWQARALGGAVVAAGAVTELRTAYRRLLVRGRHVEPPRLPRVVFVVPMLQANDAARPGFLVIVRESIESPFAALQARVTTSVTRWVDPATGEVPRQIDLAPDPIGTAHAMPGGAEAPVWNGTTIGLTQEREAGSPLFASSAVWFDSPADPAVPSALRGHDFFASVAFRWRVDRRSLETSAGDPLAADVEGPETGPWQVRLLAPFDALPILGDAEPVPLTELCFAVASQVPTFQRKSNGDLRPCVPLPPALGSEPGKLEPVLLFVAEAVVPDLLAAGRGPLAVGVWVLPKVADTGSARPVRLFWRDGAPPASRGYFLLLHSSRQLQSSPPGPGGLADLGADGPQNWDQLLLHLFGRESGVVDKDEHAEEARSMIVRMSSAILLPDAAPDAEVQHGG